MKLFGGGGSGGKSTSDNHPLVGTPYQGSIVKKVKEKREDRPNGKIKVSQEIHLQNGYVFLEAKWIYPGEELYPPPQQRRSSPLRQKPSPPLSKRQLVSGEQGDNNATVNAPAPPLSSQPPPPSSSASAPVSASSSPRKSQRNLVTDQSRGGSAKSDAVVIAVRSNETRVEPSSVGTVSTGNDSSSSHISIPLDKKKVSASSSSSSTPSSSKNMIPSDNATGLKRHAVDDAVGLTRPETSSSKKTAPVSPKAVGSRKKVTQIQQLEENHSGVEVKTQPELKKGVNFDLATTETNVGTSTAAPVATAAADVAISSKTNTVTEKEKLESTQPPDASPVKPASQSKLKLPSSPGKDHVVEGDKSSARVSTTAVLSSPSRREPEEKRKRSKSPRTQRTSNRSVKVDGHDGVQNPVGSSNSSADEEKKKALKSPLKSPKRTPKKSPSKRRKPVADMALPPLSLESEPMKQREQTKSDNDASVVSEAEIRKQASRQTTEPSSSSTKQPSAKRGSKETFDGHRSVGTLESKVAPGGPDDDVVKNNHTSTGHLTSGIVFSPPSKKKKKRAVPSADKAPSRNISVGDVQPLTKTRSKKTINLAPPIIEVEDQQDEEFEEHDKSKLQGRHKSEGKNRNVDIIDEQQVRQKDTRDITFDGKKNAESSKKPADSTSQESFQSSTIESLALASPIAESKKKAKKSKKDNRLSKSLRAFRTADISMSSPTDEKNKKKKVDADKSDYPKSPKKQLSVDYPKSPKKQLSVNRPKTPKKQLSVDSPKTPKKKLSIDSPKSPKKKLSLKGKSPRRKKKDVTSVETKDADEPRSATLDNNSRSLVDTLSTLDMKDSTSNEKSQTFEEGNDHSDDRSKVLDDGQSDKNGESKRKLLDQIKKERNVSSESSVNTLDLEKERFDTKPVTAKHDSDRKESKQQEKKAERKLLAEKEMQKNQSEATMNTTKELEKEEFHSKPAVSDRDSQKKDTNLLSKRAKPVSPVKNTALSDGNTTPVGSPVKTETPTASPAKSTPQQALKESEQLAKKKESESPTKNTALSDKNNTPVTSPVKTETPTVSPAKSTPQQAWKEPEQLAKKKEPVSPTKNWTPVISPVKNEMPTLSPAKSTPPQAESKPASVGKSYLEAPPLISKDGKPPRVKIVGDNMLRENKISVDPHPGFAKIMGIWGDRVNKEGGGVPISPLKPVKRTKNIPVKLVNVGGEKAKDDPTFSLPVFEKSEKEKNMIRQSFDGNFVFSDMMPSEIEPMVDAFEKVEYQKGDTIAQRGERDCFFYVVQDGEVDFEVEGNNVAKGKTGDVFGQLALVYNCDRATTVKASRKASILRLHQNNYRHIRKHQIARSVGDRMKLLKKVHFFKDADETDLAQLASAMVPHIFKKKEDLSSTFKDSPFCLIEEGSVTSPSETTVGKGGSFGEENLVGKNAGTSTVIALTDGIAYTIDRQSFEKVFGDMNRLALKSADKNILRGLRAVRAAKVSATELDALAQQIADHSFTAGQDIFVTNEDMVPALYVVRKGKVKVARKSGKEDIITAGGDFGQEYLMMSSKGSRDTVPAYVKAKYSAYAVEDCVLGILTLQECAAIFTKDNAKVDLENSRLVPLDDLKRHRLLGEGHFGEVWLVTNTQAPPNRTEPYALKVQYLEDKERDAQKCINEEISIMKMLSYPFVVSLINTYREEDSISMLLGLAPGGELFDQIHFQLPNGLWDSGIGEEKARFYCAVVADTLSFMHIRGYIYRDLKPENILLDKDGYPLITDFGFTKRIRRTEKTYTMCGTPNYLAPEIVRNIGHSFSADNWSLGILIYEVAQGENPFYYEGLDQVSLFHAICNEPYYDLPDEFSDEIHDIMDRLLEKHPSKRLGTYRGKDILAHPWFASMDIRKLRKKKLKAPWIPGPIEISKRKK